MLHLATSLASAPRVLVNCGIALTMRSLPPSTHHAAVPLRMVWSNSNEGASPVVAGGLLDVYIPAAICASTKRRRASSSPHAMRRAATGTAPSWWTA